MAFEPISAPNAFNEGLETEADKVKSTASAELSDAVVVLVELTATEFAVIVGLIPSPSIPSASAVIALKLISILSASFGVGPI